MNSLHSAAGRAQYSRIMISRRLHGRALEDKVPLVMDSMQGAVLAQALLPRGPSTPAQHIG